MLCCRSCTATCTWKRFILFSWFARAPAAAVLGEKRDERVHGLVVGAVDDEAPLLPALREAGARQPCEMERKRRWRQLELLADRAGGQPLQPRPHKEPEDCEPRFLG